MRLESEEKSIPNAGATEEAEHITTPWDHVRQIAYTDRNNFWNPSNPFGAYQQQQREQERRDEERRENERREKERREDERREERLREEEERRHQ